MKLPKPKINKERIIQIYRSSKNQWVIDQIPYLNDYIFFYELSKGHDDNFRKKASTVMGITIGSARVAAIAMCAANENLIWGLFCNNLVGSTYYMLESKIAKRYSLKKGIDY
jgi:hypothetical protein